MSARGFAEEPAARMTMMFAECIAETSAMRRLPNIVAAVQEARKPC